MSDRNENERREKPKSPDDVVMTAYHMKVAADYMRMADESLGQALTCLGVVRDRVVGEGDGKIGKRHMDFAPLFEDLNHLRSLMYRIGEVQEAQCHFNRKQLGNKIVTNEQLAELGGGGGR